MDALIKKMSSKLILHDVSPGGGGGRSGPCGSEMLSAVGGVLAEHVAHGGARVPGRARSSYCNGRSVKTLCSSLEFLAPEAAVRTQILSSMLRLTQCAQEPDPAGGGGESYVTLQQLVRTINLYMCKLGSQIICRAANDH